MPRIQIQPKPQDGATAQLWDLGEEQWPLKLHLGAGGIYLADAGTGYKNVDLVGDLVNFEQHVGDGRVYPNLTQIWDYYARLNGTQERLPRHRRNVIDVRANIVDPPFEPLSVDKIVCIQALEHLAPYDVDTALTHWWNLLRPGGVLIVSVPRMDDTLALLHQRGETHDFAVRHLEGSRRDEYNRHRSWFNPQDLEQLLTRHGFTAKLLDNFHLYPAVVVRAVKVDRFVPDRSYQFPLPGYDETCKTVLDVGPGEFPLSLATRCFDVNDRYQASRLVPADIGDVEHMPYEDKQWDYVYASHVIEHTADPVQALRELQRVGKRGFVQTPTVMLDWLMQHGNAHVNAAGKPARWMCLQVPNGIVFVERDPSLDAGFTDERFAKWTMRVTHYQIPLSEPEKYMRDFFWRNQHVLNASVSWSEDGSASAVQVGLDGTVMAGNMTWEHERGV